MVIDEIYTFCGSKQNKTYIWTALAFKDNNIYKYFHLSKSRTINDLFEFKLSLPSTNIVYSDGNFAYANVFGNKNIAQKGIKTNLVESFNSQLRQYVSRIKRKTKSYAKDFNNLKNSIAMVINKL